MKRIILVVSFLLVSLFPSFPSGVLAQSTNVPYGSSYIKENILSINNNCTFWPGYYGYDVRWSVAWGLASYPFFDTGSPIGYWSGNPAIINGQSFLLQPAVWKGEQWIQGFQGCATPQQILNMGRDLASQNWMVVCEFTLPNGERQNIFSVAAGLSLDLVSDKTLLTPLDKMSLTRDPINIANGEMIVTAVDFSIPSRGPDLEFTRTYRSRSGYSGTLGYGWQSIFDARLSEDGNGHITIDDKDGVVSSFVFVSADNYSPSKGNNSTIVKNPDGTFTVTDQHGVVTRYLSNNKIASVTDRNGNALNFVFDPQIPGGTYIEDAGGRRITFTFDGSGRILSAQDPQGRTVQYAYDVDGNLTTITNAAGGVTQYAYDAGHNITEMTNVNGHKTYFAYDAEDRAFMNWQDGDVNKEILNFLPGMITEVTDARGHVTTYQFNEYGFEISRTDPLGGLTATTWDFNMNKTSVTDALNRLTIFYYDGKGNLIGVTDSLAHPTQLSYTGDFNLVSGVTNALGHTTHYGYDVNGNLTSVTDALGRITQMAYDAQGNLTSLTDARNNTTSYEYDVYGNPTAVNDALLNRTTFVYDLAGNLTSMTNPHGVMTQFFYDNLNRLTETRFSDGTNLLTAYDAFGNPLSTTDQNQKTTSYIYDPYERLIQTIDPAGGTTVFSYDNTGNLTSVTDANNNMTTYLYDDNNRVTGETAPLSHVTSYTYDAAGNLTSKTNPDTTPIVYSYDALNRLTGIDYPGTADDTTYNYDALSRITSVAKPVSTASHTYDVLSRVLTTTQTLNAQPYTTTFEYDEAGNRTRVVYPSGSDIRYNFDKNNRMGSVVSDDNVLSNIGHDVLGRRSQKDLYNTATKRTSYSYDALNRLTTLSNFLYSPSKKRKKIIPPPVDITSRAVERIGEYAKGFWFFVSSLWSTLAEAQALPKLNSRFAYSYDNAGNKLSANIFQQPNTSGTTYYAYNDLYELTSVSGAQSHSYQYDSAGNRTLADGIVYIPNALNQYSQVGADIFTYDVNGNLTYDGMNTYAYDVESRLSSAVSPQSSASYAYDGLGRRISKTIDGVTTYFVYDGDRIIEERDTNDILLASYVYGDGIDEILTMNRNNSTYYYFLDGLGSVTEITNAAGDVVESNTYDVYGRPNQVSTIGNRFYFTGREFDEESGLYHNRARTYSPTIGRFLQRDPIGYADGMNVYSYVGNNPINFIDPLGLTGESKYQSWLNWWLYESALPGWYGQPVSEWWNGSPTSWGNPMGYTERAGGGWMWAERVFVGTATAATITAASLMAYEAATAIRVEFHTPHVRGPHQFPHLQGIQGPGYGKTLWRWPSSQPWWWLKP